MSETVGDIIDRMDGVESQEPKAAAPFTPETLPDVPPLPAPGVYFGMPFEQYLSLPALGAHGAQDILASPMIYWAKHTWLSETARKQAAKPQAASTAMTRLLGEAYHCRILEGPDAYAARYCREHEPPADALESTDQIKAAIKAKGGKPASKVPDQLPDGQPYERAAKKEDWVAQLLALDPDAVIASVLEREHRELHDGKQFVPADAWEQIELSARMISLDPAAKHAVTGGYPEVTFIWHCAETGVPMKARVDYLKLRAMVDLKSFANEHRSAEQAVIRAIAAFKYNFQPSVYFEGAQAVKAMVRQKGRISVWDGDGAPLQSQVEWTEKWAAEESEPDWFWLFQQKGVAPVTRLVRYDGRLSTRIATDQLLREAKAKFRQCCETFGCDPWLDLAPAYDLSDDDVPDWAVRI